MKQKLKYILCTITNAFIIAGVIIWFIGLYYSVVKAGIPYQDPPLDLQIQYEINAGIGNVLAETGFKTAVIGSIIRFVLSLSWKFINKK
ncbi:MAG: hypothetical protein HFH68_04485 [Lachnospiraceae bacterium]|nr:hypothetical protein [Lachnospiraceae bacterium]